MFETLSAPTEQVALYEDAPLALFAIFFLTHFYISNSDFIYTDEDLNRCAGSFIYR